MLCCALGILLAATGVTWRQRLKALWLVAGHGSRASVLSAGVVSVLLAGAFLMHHLEHAEAHQSMVLAEILAEPLCGAR